MRIRQVCAIGQQCHRAWVRSLCTSRPARQLSNKRTLPKDFPPQFDAAACTKWYDHWESEGLFKPSGRTDGRTYNVLLPPPNVTGRLHIGHALTVAVEDALCRWQRMCGANVQYVPGTDHAGIATQSRVERLLKDQGVDVASLSREERLQHVLKWKEEHGDAIMEQLRQLGISSDWSRQFFTLDKPCAEAVNQAFIQLFKRGLIYRDVRFANWCCHLKTVISDIEIDEEHYDKPTEISVAGYPGKVTVGVMYHVAYPLEGGGEVVAATTRPETIPADAALAVHPDDLRYRHLHGSSAYNPVTHKSIPIICDAELVDMEKGTGVVKVTPYHDPRDYECGLRHGLAMEMLFDKDGDMLLTNGNVVHRFAGRLLILDSLKHSGFYRGSAAHPMTVQRCSRSGDIIEPILYPQWFLRMGDFCKDAISAVDSGKLKIGSPDHQQLWKDWLGKERDWCISRQLYWGHRIPAWKVVEGLPASRDGDADSTDDGEEVWVVGATEAEAKEQAVSQYNCNPDTVCLKQDEDVLDTWFSSGLLPLSQAGWPSTEISDFYPLSVMETGHDILFFWVARMYMMCTALHPDNQPPFSRVLLHPMVKDAYGAKMSKSKGNAVDPMDLINGTSYENLLSNGAGLTLSSDRIKEVFPDAFPACGADALRLALAGGSSISEDHCRPSMNFDVHDVIQAHAFCTKVWNGVRFAYMIWPAGFTASPLHVDGKAYSMIDRWIMNKSARLVADYQKAMERQAVGDAARLLEEFFRDQLCTQYFEFVKVSSDVSESMDVLYASIALGLQVMHPFMPFITEELWQRLPHPDNVSKSILDSRLPSAEDLSMWLSDEVDAVKQAVQLVANQGIQVSRNYKAKEATLCIIDPWRYDAVRKSHEMLVRFLRLERLNIQNEMPSDTTGLMALPFDGDCAFFMDMTGINVSGMRKGYSSQLTRLEGQRERLQLAMARDKYVRAPAHIQAQDRERLEDLGKSIAGIKEAMALLPPTTE